MGEVATAMLEGREPGADRYHVLEKTSVGG
jgi:hypothetical protein